MVAGALSFPYKLVEDLLGSNKIVLFIEVVSFAA